MKNKIFEIKQALNLRLYNSALTLSLTLPAICAKVEFGDIKGDKKRYIAWFDKYAIGKFTFKTNRIPDGKPSEYVSLDGNTCYKIRCAVLHAGNFDVDDCKYDKIMIHGHEQSSKIFEHEFTKTKVIDDNDEIIYEKIFHLDINRFCNLLCLAAEEYYDSIEDKSKFNVEDVAVLDW